MSTLARGIFMVIDGVGGQAAGGKAADTALAMLRTRLERETGPVAIASREAIADRQQRNPPRSPRSRPEWNGMACVLTVAVVDDGTRDRRPRRRHEALQAARRPHREGHARSLAGRRARRCARAVRARGDAASAPQRGVSRRRLGAARARRSRVHRRPRDAVRAGCGAAALQRRPDRPGRLVARSSRSSSGRRAIRSASCSALIDAANAAGGKDNVTRRLCRRGAVRGAAPDASASSTQRRGDRSTGQPGRSSDVDRARWRR